MGVLEVVLVVAFVVISMTLLVGSLVRRDQRAGLIQAAPASPEPAGEPAS